MKGLAFRKTDTDRGDRHLSQVRSHFFMIALELQVCSFAGWLRTCLSASSYSVCPPGLPTKPGAPETVSADWKITDLIHGPNSLPVSRLPVSQGKILFFF